MSCLFCLATAMGVLSVTQLPIHEGMNKHPFGYLWRTQTDTNSFTFQLSGWGHACSAFRSDGRQRSL